MVNHTVPFGTNNRGNKFSKAKAHYGNNNHGPGKS